MSRIYKQTSSHAHARPLVMEPLSGAGQRAGDRAEAGNVGSTLASLEREAYEKGFSSGEKAGFELGRQKAEVLFTGLGKIIDELANFKQSLYAPCVDEMVALSLAIARKVVQRELETNKESVLSALEGALKKVVAGGEVAIRVNPRDLEIVRQYAPELVKCGDGVKDVSIDGDESVSRGGCLIDTRFGEIDATIESITKEVEARLKDAH